MEEMIMEKTLGERFVSEVYEYWEWLVSIVVCVVFILSFGVRTVAVHGESMEPTLIEGDSLVTTRLGGDPEQGQIVAIVQPNASNLPLIKRVIATEGQTITFDASTGDVYVDGQALNESYIAEKIWPESVQMGLFPQVVPAGCVFVMGDNRNHSWDSRSLDIGMIDDRYILGKVLFRFAPFEKFGRV